MHVFYFTGAECSQRHGVSHQFISVLGPGQVADLRAGVHALQRLRCQGIPKSNAAVGGAAARGQQAVLMGGPGDGFNCSQVIDVRLHGTERRVVPHQQLRPQIEHIISEQSKSVQSLWLIKYQYHHKKQNYLVVISTRGEQLMVSAPLQTAHFLSVSLQAPL